MQTKYDIDLPKDSTNHEALTPLRFLVRAAEMYPDRIATIYGNRRYTWHQFAERCRKLSSALIAAGINRGDTVSILAPNTLANLEAQFGVPMSGAVLNCINSRLDTSGIRFILQHSECRVLLVDCELAPNALEALKGLPEPPLVIDIADDQVANPTHIGTVEYEDFIAAGNSGLAIRWPEDEWNAIALNYTSGTTGDPKGVVYHHRGAYLNSITQIVNARMTDRHVVYLWTLPLFHCNGWCYAWALAAVGGTQICLRKVTAPAMYDAIRKHGVTLLCGAPIVLGFLGDGCPSDWKPPERQIRVLSGGASPPARVFRRLEELGFEVLHVYGMTEMHGVATLCEPLEYWDALPPAERLRRMGRQGVRSLAVEEMMVADPATLTPVAHDGKTLGEIFLRGNVTMKGYLKNPGATARAFTGGWYHTGDLAVVHEDGYIEIRDRSKDIIISGGENVSSIEIEEILLEHSAVMSVAVVAVPDARWGETPCAIVELDPSRAGTIEETELIAFCRERLAGFKCPRHIIFAPLERTATGKLQKFRLRDFAASKLHEAGRM